MLSMFAVAVELSCRRDAIILSLPCSSFELIPLIIATTQEHWGADQVIFKDNNIHSRRKHSVYFVPLMPYSTSNIFRDLEIWVT